MYDYLLDEKNLFNKIISNKTGDIALTILLTIPSLYLLSNIFWTLIYNLIETLNNQNKKLIINEDVRFFSNSDILYCIELFSTKQMSKNSNGKLQELFNKYIYSWTKNFRYSSRIVNAHVVAFLAMYYFFVLWIFEGIRLLDFISSINSEISKFFLNFLNSSSYLI